MVQQTNTIIIGASAAGLACAACLKKQQSDFLLLEQQAVVGHTWRNRYDRLHLHTDKYSSSLPFLPFPRSMPRYPSGKEVADYLEHYSRTLNIQPVFLCKAERIEKPDRQWLVHTNGDTYQARNIIVATGYNRKPNIPQLQGMSDFPGVVLHSSDYRNGKAFKNQDVLVVGFGNSACEIAICLHEHEARPALCVRSPVNVIPRDIMGIPAVAIGMAESFLPVRIQDFFNKPVIRWCIGDIRTAGLQPLPYGPMEQIKKYQKVPLLDIGTMRLIRQGKIRIYPAIHHIAKETIHFVNQQQHTFSTIILATGYHSALEELLPPELLKAAADRKGFHSATDISGSGLYLCGFYVSTTGMLHSIGLEARRIARSIQQKKNQTSVTQ